MTNVEGLFETCGKKKGNIMTKALMHKNIMGYTYKKYYA